VEHVRDGERLPHGIRSTSTHFLGLRKLSTTTMIITESTPTSGSSPGFSSDHERMLIAHHDPDPAPPARPAPQPHAQAQAGLQRQDQPDDHVGQKLGALRDAWGLVAP
jgi:hypothetical protein